MYQNRPGCHPPLLTVVRVVTWPVRLDGLTGHAATKGLSLAALCSTCNSELHALTPQHYLKAELQYLTDTSYLPLLCPRGRASVLKGWFSQGKIAVSFLLLNSLKGGNEIIRQMEMWYLGRPCL